MAPRPKTVPTDGSAEVTTTSDYDFVPVVPQATRGGRPGENTNELRARIAAMPLPSDKGYASFFLPITPVADTITDPAERAKATKEAQRKAANGVNSQLRAIQRRQEAFDVATRNDNAGGVDGIRVFRMADKTAEQVAAAKAARDAKVAAPASAPAVPAPPPAPPSPPAPPVP